MAYKKTYTYMKNSNYSVLDIYIKYLKKKRNSMSTEGYSKFALLFSAFSLLLLVVLVYRVPTLNGAPMTNF